MREMKSKIKETLEKQLELLSERAEKCTAISDLIEINHAINETLQIVILLDRENRLQRGVRASRDLASAQPSEES